MKESSQESLILFEQGMKLKDYQDLDLFIANHFEQFTDEQYRLLHNRYYKLHYFDKHTL